MNTDSLNKPDAMAGDELTTKIWRFAKYCNGLTPYKLDEPKDPIVEGAVNDFIDSLEAYTTNKIIEELENVYNNINTGNVYFALGKVKSRIAKLRKTL